MLFKILPRLASYLISYIEKPFIDPSILVTVLPYLHPKTNWGLLWRVNQCEILVDSGHLGTIRDPRKSPSGSPAKAVSDTLLMGIPSASGRVHTCTHNVLIKHFEFEDNSSRWRIISRTFEDWHVFNRTMNLCHQHHHHKNPVRALNQKRKQASAGVGAPVFGTSGWDYKWPNGLGE